MKTSVLVLAATNRETGLPLSKSLCENDRQQGHEVEYGPQTGGGAVVM